MRTEDHIKTFDKQVDVYVRMKNNDKLLDQIDRIQKQNEAYAQELHLLRCVLQVFYT